jgi:hypothetical protein
MENEWKLISLSFKNDDEKDFENSKGSSKDKKNNNFIRRTTFVIRLNSNFPISFHSS